MQALLKANGMVTEYLARSELTILVVGKVVASLKAET